MPQYVIKVVWSPGHQDGASVTAEVYDDQGERTTARVWLAGPFDEMVVLAETEHRRLVGSLF